jgi:hypothetical protein
LYAENVILLTIEALVTAINWKGKKIPVAE